MKTKHSYLNLLVLLLLMLHISCSNSSSGGGVGGSGIISRGSITEFGSIVVGGTTYDTSQALIVVDGEELGTGDAIVMNNLDVGRVVTVQGTEEDSDENVAAEIVIYNEDVTGPVSNIVDIEPETKEINVMGQVVILNNLTSYKNTSFEGVAVDEVVEVSGFYNDLGTIYATFLEKVGEISPGLIYEVKGFVQGLDTDQSLFFINNLEVDYQLADLSGLEGNALQNGLLVEVEGTLNETGVNMQALSVSLEDELEAEDADEVEVMGFVTALISTVEFTIGNQVVVIEEGAVFIDGTPDEIILGVKLEAEGTLEAGVLYAEEIEFWLPDQSEIEGVITSMVSINEFTVDDQTVVTNAETEYEGGEPGDLEVGIEVEIKGRMTAGVMIADKVSFEYEGD